MFRIGKLGMFSLALAVALVSVPVSNAQQSKETPAPVPAQIVSAKKVFISNAGMDTTSLAAFKRAGEPDLPYNRFYASMKSWGRYELVAAPADADLVLEIRFTSPLTDCGKIPTYQPQLDLAILDARTHFRLWTFTEPVQVAFRKPTWVNNVGQAIANLLDDVRKVAMQPATRPAS